MTKRDITLGEIVEGMAIGIYHARNGNGAMHWARRSNSYKQPYLGDGRASLSHLLTTANITEAQLIALVNKKAVVVPAELTEEQAEHMCAAGQICGGIAESVYRAALKARPQ